MSPLPRWLDPILRARGASRRVKLKRHPATRRRLCMEPLEDRRLLAYTVSFNPSDNYLTIAKASGDAAALTVSESGSNLNIADSGGTQFNQGMVAGAIGVSVSSTGVTIDQTLNNIAHVVYDLTSGTSFSSDTVTFAAMTSPIQGFDILGVAKASDSVTFSGNLTTSSSASAATGNSNTASINLENIANVVLSAANVTIATAATTGDTPGNVSLGGYPSNTQIDTNTYGGNLTIDTSPVGAVVAVAGGGISLGNIGPLETGPNLDNLVLTSWGSNGGVAGGITLGGNITTTGAQTYNGPLFLPVGVALTSNGPAAASNITFGSTIIGGTVPVPGNRGLTESVTEAGAALAVDTAGTITFNAAVSQLSELNAAGGAIQMAAGSVDTLGPQFYTGPVTVASSTTLTSTGSTTYNYAAGVTFGSTVATTATVNYPLTVNTPGLTDFVGQVGGLLANKNLQSLTIESGPVEFGGWVIETQLQQYYAGAVFFQSSTLFATTAGYAIDFNSTVDSLNNANTLAIETTGLTTFNGAVGNITSSPDLSYLDVESGPTQIGAGTISTVYTQTYAGPVTVSASTTLASEGTFTGTNDTTDTGAITFGSTVASMPNATYALSVNTQGETDFAGQVGGQQVNRNLQALNIETGPVLFEASCVETQTSQTYAGAVTIEGSTTFRTTGAANIVFESTLNSDNALNALVIMSPGTVTFDGGVGTPEWYDGEGTTPTYGITTLNVTSGPIVVNNTYIETTGSQSYAGAFTITGTTGLVAEGGSIALASSLNGQGSATNLAVDTTGGVQLEGAVGGSESAPNLASLALYGPIVLAAPLVATTGAQLYYGAVTLAASTTLTSTSAGSISFASTVDAGAAGAGLTVATAFDYASTSGTPQLFSAAVGSQQPLAYLAANVEGTIVVNDPITTTGDLLIGSVGGNMPANIEVNANLTSSVGTIGLSAGSTISTSAGETISSPDGTISFWVGNYISPIGGGSTNTASPTGLVSLYSSMQATAVSVTGAADSNQLELAPPGQDSIVDEATNDSGTIGSYQGVSTSGAAEPPIEYSGIQNIAFAFSGASPRATGTLSIFTAYNGSSQSLTNVIDPIASFNPAATSSPANTETFYLQDTWIDQVQVRVGQGNQIVNASQTNAATLLEGSAYQQADVSDTLIGGHNVNVLIGGNIETTLEAGDGADVTGGTAGNPAIANYIFSHYQYTVAGGVGQWQAAPTTYNGDAIDDTVLSPATTQNAKTTNLVVANGPDSIKLSGTLYNGGQATVAGGYQVTSSALSQTAANSAQANAIAAMFPAVTASELNTSGSSGTAVTAPVAINYSPTPTSQTTTYVTPPLFYVPAIYTSGAATGLLIGGTSNPVGVSFNAAGTQLTISVGSYSQTLATSQVSSIEIPAAEGLLNQSGVDVSLPTAASQTSASLGPDNAANTAAIRFSGSLPAILIGQATSIVIVNAGGNAASLATIYQLWANQALTSQVQATGYASGAVSTNSSYAHS